MKYFYAVVHKDDDSAYGVQFPDLPGCFSAADHNRDIVPNAIEALSLWFEDQPVVEPSDVNQIVGMAVAELERGAFMVMVPWIGAPTRTARINLSIDATMLDAIDSAAAQRRLTRSAFLAQAARNEIEGRH